jgi:hypothetical protein
MMKKLTTYLAILVLGVQTILPNFLYANDESSNGTEATPSLTAATATPSNPASGDDEQVVIDGDLPSNPEVCEAPLVRDADDAECVELIVLDEGEEVVPPLPAEPTEENNGYIYPALEPSTSVEKADSATAATPQILAQPVALNFQTAAVSCSSDLNGIKNDLLSKYAADATVQELSSLLTNFSAAGTAMDNLIAGQALSAGELTAIDTLLTNLKNVDFGAMANVVDDFAAYLTGDFTTCTKEYLVNNGAAQ